MQLYGMRKVPYVGLFGVIHINRDTLGSPTKVEAFCSNTIRHLQTLVHAAIYAEAVTGSERASHFDRTFYHLLIEAWIHLILAGHRKGVAAIAVHARAVLETSKRPIVRLQVLRTEVEQPVVIVDDAIVQTVIGAETNDRLMMIEVPPCTRHLRASESAQEPRYLQGSSQVREVGAVASLGAPG